MLAELAVRLKFRYRKGKYAEDWSHYEEDVNICVFFLLIAFAPWLSYSSYKLLHTNEMGVSLF